MMFFPNLSIIEVNVKQSLTVLYYERDFDIFFKECGF